MSDMNTICALITAKTLMGIEFFAEIAPVFRDISRPNQDRLRENTDEQSQPER
jgi:hypothetical protein